MTARQVSKGCKMFGIGEATFYRNLSGHSSCRGAAHDCIGWNVTQVEIQIGLPARVDYQTVRVVGVLTQRVAGGRVAVLAGGDGECV